MEKTFLYCICYLYRFIHHLMHIALLSLFNSDLLRKMRKHHVKRALFTKMLLWRDDIFNSNAPFQGQHTAGPGGPKISGAHLE